jgi:heme/copper-type cytochrome/quinol oxidase subunit 3
VTLALPAAPAPPARRQVLVVTALGCMAGTMLIGGMLAIWMTLRGRVVDVGDRFPESYTIAEVASNVMLMTIGALVVFAQWAVYSAKRKDRVNFGIAQAVTVILGVAFINAQAFVYSQMGMPIVEGYYPGLFYAMTGTIVALVAVGIVFSSVAAFRYLGGRSFDTELVSASALYWYFVATAFAAVWFFVYVTK